MTINLDEIEKRASAATKGPWRCDDRHPDDVVIWAPSHVYPDDPTYGNLLCNVGHSRIGEVGVAFDADAINGAFIAHAREDVPALVTRVRELEQAAEGLLRCFPASRHEANPLLNAALRDLRALASR